MSHIEHLICPKCKGENKIRVRDRYGLICLVCHLVFTFDDVLRTLNGEDLVVLGEI